MDGIFKYLDDNSLSSLSESSTEAIIIYNIREIKNELLYSDKHLKQ